MFQIMNGLARKGYRKLNPESNNVYGRVDDDAVYVVVIGSNHDLSAEDLRDFNNKILLDLSFNSHKKVKILNILITPNGMFDDETLDIVKNLDGVWLFTEDYGKLYIFENQPSDFDGLYDVIDKQLVLENERSNRTLKSMFGVITPILVLLNVVVYIACVYSSGGVGGIPLEYRLAVNVQAISEGGEFYRFFTAMFTHFGLAHLFGNMVILIALGARVENLLGKFEYLAAYIVTGLTSSVVSYFECLAHGTYDYAAGASGAIFGLLGILVAIAIKNKGRVKDLSLMNMIILLVLTIVNGQLSEGIDNVAHIAGFVAGIVVGVILLLANQKVVNNSHL